MPREDCRPTAGTRAANASRDRRRTVSRAALCAAGMVVAILAGPVFAQEGTRPAAAVPVESPTSKPEVAPRSPLDRLPAQVIYLPNAQGQLVPVPAEATLEKYLQWLKTQEGPAAAAVPAAVVSSIDLTGRAEDERVAVTVQVEVQVNDDSRPVKVPVGFGEAVLTKIEYSGEGEGLFGGLDRDLGYSWWFKGKGSHRLRLEALVPVRKQLPSRRLTLSLPATAVSRARLTLPYPSVTVRGGDQTAVPVKATADGQSQVELFGLGPRLDLSWQPIPTMSAAENLLEASTSIVARLASDSIVLEANQRLRPLQGSFERFTVRLPPGGELLAVESKDYRDRKVDPSDPQRVTVELLAATTSLVSVNWTVRIPYDAQRKAVLEGFVVEGAKKQSGDVGLIPLEGLRLNTQEGKDPNLVRISAGEWRSSNGTGQITRAYRFVNQPFRLLVSAEPVPAYSVSEPQLFLLAATDQLTLDAEFPVQVYRGSIQELVIDWPGWKKEGWLIESIGPRGELIESVSLDNPAGGEGDAAEDQIRLRLVDHRTDRLRVALRARRPLRNDERPTITLPQVLASSRLPSTLTLVSAENVESELAPQGKTVVRALPPNPRDRVQLPPAYYQLKSTSYRLEPDEQTLAVKIAPQPQSVRTESITECQLLENRLLSVTQFIEYDVGYERLAQVRLGLPAGLTQGVTFFREDEELTPSWLPAGEDGSHSLRLPLAQPLIGRFVVECRFNLPLPDPVASSGERTLAVPIIQSGDSDFASTGVRFVPSQWLAATTTDTRWTARLTRDQRTQWMTGGAVAAFPLHLNPVGAGDSEQTIISKAWLRGSFDQQGRGQCHAVLRLSGAVANLNVQLPPQDQPGNAQFSWDGRRVEESAVTELPGDEGKYVLRLSEEGVGGDHVLTVDYQLPAAPPLGWHDRVTVVPPSLPQCSWVSQVVWQVTLPSDQHLLNYPRTVTPMFRWRHEGLFWRRVPNAATPELAQWIEPEPPRPGAEVEDVGNVYAFSQFGTPGPLQVQTLSGPMIVLIGAGTSLAMGFLLLRLPVMRHVLTLLAIALALAVLGLWFMPPIELLLQPAIIGLLFPTLAIFLELRYRRRAAADVLTLQPPPGVESPDPLSSHRSHPGFSSVEVTQLRRSNPTLPVTADSRSGVS